jgi:hypothetical protein
LFSSRFGWTPEQIEKLTHEQIEIYINRINHYESIIPDTRFNINLIKRVLFAFFKIDDRTQNEKELDTKKAFGKIKQRNAKDNKKKGRKKQTNLGIIDDMPDDLINEWIEAGTPDLNEFRKKHKTRLIK